MMTNDEILEIATKLYQRKKNGWFIAGYRCPYCEKHYHTLRNEFFTHVRKRLCKTIKKENNDASE
jgi:hypothetical protein